VSDFNSAGALPHHRLPITQLDSLAAGTFDGDAMATLLAAERSRRLLLLCAVLDYARARRKSTGPLAPVDTAWSLLLRAESTAPEVVMEMLADPQTGTWVAHTLRRLRNVSDDPAPLWFHVGQLHAFALAAAIRAGLRAALTVPVWDGAVLLPSLGCLHLPIDARWTHAEVIVDSIISIRCAGTATEFDHRTGKTRDPGTSWFPLRSRRSTAADLDLVVLLDSLAAYRGLDNPVRPRPLDAAGADRWQALLDEAWALLVRDHPDRAGDLASGMASIVPEPAVHRFRPRSTSVEDAFGSAILSEPHDAAQFAVTLIHEFQHSVLNGVRHLVDLVSGDDPATGYAPWRDDPRPVGALFHGVFAFTAVAEFWSVHRNRVSGSDADLAHFEFALWRYQTTAVLRKIRGHQALTVVGKRFLNGIGKRLAQLSSEPLPKPILAAAQAAANDHAASWRACHLLPTPERVRAVAEAWVTGRPPPPDPGAEPTVQSDFAVPRLDAKAVLTRVRIADPSLFNRLHAEPDLVQGASHSDVALVAGDLERARRGYLAELSRTPGRAAAWSGLGLTLAASGEGRAAKALLHQPELLRAVVARVAAEAPTQPPADELAAWLSNGVD
jgi:HEXXH motif-containing protein